MTRSLFFLWALWCLGIGVHTVSAAEPTLAIGDRRELFVDGYLIDRLDGLRLQLHSPRDEGAVLHFDQPWEGPFCTYSTVLRDGDRLRAYYRGKPTAAGDGQDEVTCVAESTDGVAWSRPQLDQVELRGSAANNIVLGNVSQLTHNFSPLRDENPAAPAAERFKALCGTQVSGIVPFVSADGLRWKRLHDQPVLTKEMVTAAIDGVEWVFDSQNLAFWSPAERKYVAYFRIFKDRLRRIGRAESDDFVTWSNIQLMEYRNKAGASAPVEHLYTNQTAPYFRAPHIYVATAARFMPKRQVLSEAEAEALQVNPRYFKDTSDAVLLTTRGGDTYDRTFLEALIRPGIGARNWVSRTNYPALGVVQTGPAEMSIYVNQDYAQPTAHLHRYSFRLDGFASLNAGYEGGEMTTKPLTFTGNRLLWNFSTSAAGGIRCEIQDENGRPMPGFALADSVETIGNEIKCAARWKSGDDVGALAGRVVRLRFVMKDADLFAIRFGETAVK